VQLHHYPDRVLHLLADGEIRVLHCALARSARIFVK
jgi:hypothetical protein